MLYLKNTKNVYGFKIDELYTSIHNSKMLYNCACVIIYGEDIKHDYFYCDDKELIDWLISNNILKMRNGD